MKSFRLLFILLLISHYVYSQEFNGGLTGGITACQIDGDHLGGYDKFGFSAGIFVCRDFSESVGAQLELKYTMKGANSKDKNQILSLHYTEIPVFINYNLSKFNVSEPIKRIEFELGMAPAILIGVTNKTFPLIEELASIDIAGLVGIGFFVFEKLKISTRFTYTLFGVAPFEMHERNNVFNFSLHYYLKE